MASKQSHVVITILLVCLLTAEVLTLAFYKSQIQSQFCGLAAWLRETFLLGDTVNSWMKWFHHQTNSFVYMQVACVITFLIDANIGAEMFTFTVCSHVVKNFSKSFIASPRGFWYCTTGRAISCGGGYSLPSGHSMMSLLTILFLSRRLPKWRGSVLFIGGLFELYTIFEILYLGTHTPTDVIVGFTMAGVCFMLSILWEHDTLQRFRTKLFSNAELQTIFLSLLTSAIYFLEVHEEALEDATSHLPQLQLNYEKYCDLQPGTGATHMRNSSAFEKTALFAGLTIALYLRRRFSLEGDGGDVSVPARLVRTVAAAAVFTYSKALIKKILTPYFMVALVGNWKYLPFLVQPSLILWVFPLLFNNINLGHFSSRFKIKLK